jgi:hypothetical protein
MRSRPSLRTNRRAERDEYSALTIAELRLKIADAMSRLDQSELMQQGSAAKRTLMARWESGAPMSRLDLQRVLRVVDSSGG